jgi:hypothetical protein
MKRVKSELGGDERDRGEARRGRRRGGDGEESLGDDLAAEHATSASRGRGETSRHPIGSERRSPDVSIGLGRNSSEDGEGERGRPGTGTLTPRGLKLGSKTGLTTWVEQICPTYALTRAEASQGGARMTAERSRAFLPFLVTVSSEHRLQSPLLRLALASTQHSLSRQHPNERQERESDSDTNQI